MSHDIESIYDMLARVQSEMDQTQALIDEARSQFPNDQNWQLELDRKSSELNEKRKRVKLMKYAADIVYKKD